MRFLFTLLAAALLLASPEPLSAQRLISSEFKGLKSREDLVKAYGSLIRFSVKFYKITYTTPDVFGKPDTASGLIAYPDVPEGVFPLLVYQHGTVGSRDDVPSNLRGGYEIAEVFAGLGYISLAPDFLGLGESRGFHPYVHAASEASAAVDMLFAAREFAGANKVLYNQQLFITGYSQGGHAAAALQREIEKNYRKDFTVTASGPMSGPYSISGEMRRLILSDQLYYYPAYLINTILSYNYVYRLYDGLQSVLKEPYASMAQEYLLEKTDLGSLNERLIDTLTRKYGGPVTKKMLQDSVLENFTRNPGHPINAALKDNDVFDWKPEAPTRLLYCTGDDQVPFLNSIIADSVMRSNGARDVASANMKDKANHRDCVEPAVRGLALYFGFLQQIGTSSTGSVNGIPVSAYPNPAQHTLTIGAPPASRVELLDLNGRIHLRHIQNTDQETVSIHHLPPGIYLLRLRTMEGVWTTKIVKN